MSTLTLKKSTSAAEKPQFRIGSAIAYLTLGVTTFLVVFPFWWMLVVASNEKNEIAKNPPRFTIGDQLPVTFDVIFQYANISRAIAISFIISISMAVSHIFFCTFAGYAFAKLKFKGQKQFFAFILLTMMVPGQLGIIPMYILVSRLGWNNDLKAIIVPGLVSAFGVFWMRQSISAVITDEVIQAARIDGATPWQIYTKIVFPLVRPTALVMGLFSFLGAWNDFLWPMLILDGDKMLTVQMAIAQMKEQAYIVNHAAQMGAAFFATLPLIILFFFVSKQLVKGVMEGAIKG
jgi:cellobiose transport system permease protein